MAFPIGIRSAAAMAAMMSIAEGLDVRLATSSEKPQAYGGFRRDRGPARLAPAIVPGSPKVCRNDPCPCGSGKKFKKCCYGA